MLTRCGELAGSGEPLRRAFLFEEEVVVPDAPRLREGRDYSSVAEAEAILAKYGVEDSAPERPTCSDGARVWASQILYEVRMFNRTNQFRDGGPWGDQPWWLIELLNRFWDGVDAGEEDASRSA